MWSQSPNETTNTIPPNLLKNFNVYEVLEPQKNSAKNREETNVDKLIDIDDCSQDSGFQDSELNASFFDKNRDFTLVDLYQNIFVTPQHIKQNVASNKNTSFDSDVLNDDFKQFFDILESDQKIDWTQFAHFKGVSKRDELLQKPRVLVPKVVTEQDTDPEDLINEVLAQKKIEKRILQKYYHAHNVDNVSENVIKSTNTTDFALPSLNNSFSKESKFESIDNENMPSTSAKHCPIDSQINNSFAFTVRAMQKDEKVYKKKRLIKPVSQTSKFTKGPDFNEKSVVLPQIMSRIIARQTYLDEINSQKKRLILDTGEKVVKIGSQNISNKIKPPNVNDAFGTNLVNSDRSPTSNEAKLCMNQVTETIAVHTSTKNCMNCNKRFANENILGAHSLTLDPTLKEAKLFTQQATAPATSPAKTKNSCNPSGKGVSSLGEVFINTNKRIGANSNTPSVSKFNSLLDGHSIKNDQGFGGNGIIPSASRVSSSSGGVPINKDKGFGKVSPTVLMADCNKERLKAWQQSKMFKNFVLNGKFEL